MLMCLHWEKGEGGWRYKRKKSKSKKRENERVRYVGEGGTKGERVTIRRKRMNRVGGGGGWG